MISSSTQLQSSSTQPRIGLVKEPTKVGDADQISGVAAATSKYFSKQGKKVECQEIEISKFTNNNLTNNSIIIAAGSEGARSILNAQLEQNNNNPLDNHLTVCLMHQLCPEMESLIKNNTNPRGADIVALPSHAVTKDIINKFRNSQTTLIITIGVCHNVHVKDIIKEYNLFKDQFPKAQRYIGIVLAGDAPDSSNTWSLFTQQEAEDLAMFISNYIHKNKEFETSHLLITNGPRTGKFITKGVEDKKAHREGNTDLVTQKFMEILGRQGITNKTLYDFQYDSQSLFKAILWVLEAATSASTQSKFFVPGESISMVSQAKDNLTIPIIIYRNGAMNPNHEKYVDDVHKAGGVQVLEGYKDMLPAIKNSGNGQTTYTPASKIVAEQIYKQYYK